MPDFTDSLTIRILGDSSPLQRELDAVTTKLTNFQSQLAGLANTSAPAANLTRPLEQLSRLFDRVTNQARTLSRLPVTLNVAPALNSLQTLGRAIDSIAAKLRAVAVIPFGAPQPIPAPPIRRFAEGGLVTGPAGTDRVPALLTSGEFVLRPSAVQQLGLTFLNALNHNRTSSPPHAPTTPVVPPSHTTNYGGITLNVTQPTDLPTLLRDLRFQATTTRTRRG